MGNKEDSNGNSRLKRKDYEKELRQASRRALQASGLVKHKGLRVIVVFERSGRRWEGWNIRAITERVSPRVFRLVALPAPSDGKSQMYMQRYMRHFPAAGEIVIFDRSW